MLPVTDSLENLSKELVHVGDPNENDIGFVAKDDINRKELAMSTSELATMVRITYLLDLCSICLKTLKKGSKSFSRLSRGRKRRTVPRELDFTGYNPIMVVEHPKKQKVAVKGADYKGEQLSPMLERSVDIVDELTQELVFEYECKTVVNYCIDKQGLKRMTTEELRGYAKFFAARINHHQHDRSVN
ncbi:2454_t:CDS:2 [Paraglomus brasilianum]|uniref:2454_t:CDS:1 n=1 Tax=Paraglomus brasilianum TaxID=144538 RepID=A0A9N8ZV85_9GLOM|nr:2454_t:CDS:2 [Paraglomus brasilianum]